MRDELADRVYEMRTFYPASDSVKDNALRRSIDRMRARLASLTLAQALPILAVLMFPLYVHQVYQVLAPPASAPQSSLSMPSEEAWPLAAALLHPIINIIPGAIDPRFTDWDSNTKLIYGIEQGILRAVGALAIVGGIAKILERRLQRLKGGIALHDPAAVLYLDINGLPFAYSFAEQLRSTYAGHQGPRNLFYASLYPHDQPKPEHAPHNWYREWYAEPVDIETDATDSGVLHRAGALHARCVIIACNRRDVLRVNALSIWSWRNENGYGPSMIIPVAQDCFGESTSIQFTDIDGATDQPVAVAETPICPFKELRRKLVALTAEDPTVRRSALDFLTWSVPKTRLESRLAKLARKAEELSRIKRTRPIRLYLNGERGDTGNYRTLLEKSMSVRDVFAICDDADNADLILTYGDCSLTGDSKINDWAENLRQDTSIGDKMHLYLTFGQGNEDNASLAAEGGFSIQRIIARLLAEEAASYLRPVRS